jgi:hypothetical protein
LPLGLPDWQSFIRMLCDGTGIQFSRFVDMEPPDALQRIRDALKTTEFIRRIQHSLTLPPTRTSLTLLALARTGVRRIVTTNLDFAVENSYALAGVPIPPSQVLSGYTDSLLRVTLPASHSIQLFKIHGSLERPDSWVLTRDDYDKAYGARSDLEKFITHSIEIPFFIGFSLTDYDVAHCLRVASLTHGKRSYAVLPISRAEQMDERLRNKGVIPLYFHTFDQISETLDDVFGLSTLTVRKICDAGSGDEVLSFSGIEVPCRSGGKSVPTGGEDVITAVLANALEGRPNLSTLDKESRRQHGLKGQWRRDLQNLLSKATVQENFDIFSRITSALLQCPELVLDNLIPSLLSAESIDVFSALSTLLSVAKEFPDIRTRVLEVLSIRVHDHGLTLSARRAVAKVLGENERHPAQRFPPDTVTIGNIATTIYPLTRYQIGILKSDRELRTRHPIRPYTLNAISEVHLIVERLSEETSQKWKIPTRKEWLMIAGRDPDDGSIPKELWPWGPDKPKKEQHAHLNFSGDGGLAQHPLEVGVFPLGMSQYGLFDLIGNVYDLCREREEGEFVLAGGSWTTLYHNERPEAFRWITRFGAGAGNIGLRPILERA